RTKEQTVQTAVVQMSKVAENDGSLVRPAIPVGVFKSDDIRRVGYIQAAAMPDEAHRENQLVHEDVRRFIPAIAIAIFQDANSARAAELLEFGVEVQPGRLSDEEAPSLIEGAEHGEMNVRRTGGALDRVAGRNS